MSAKRVPKRWVYNNKYNITKFDLDDINEANFINHLLVMQQSDFTFSFMMRLFGSYNGKAFAQPYDEFEVPKGMYTYYDKDKKKELKNTKPFLTTLGIYILNIYLLNGFDFSYLFNGYINKNFGKKLMGNINQTLTYALIEDRITVAEMKKWHDYAQFLMPFEDILGQAHTEAIFTFARDIDKKKKEYLKEHGEEIKNGNLVLAEKMEKDLIKYAEESLKDEPGLDPYISGGGGNMSNNFKNLYIMKGPVKDPDPNAKKKYNVIISNLFNGITAEEYPVLANALANGPYSRAKKTEKGGYWEKLLLYALQTVVLEDPGSDCGTKQYITVELTEKNINKYMYNYIVKGNNAQNTEELTSQNMKNYIGKKVNMRFCIYCKSKIGVCNKCAGNLFYRRGARNLGVASPQIASVLKVKSMKAFHDSTVSTHQIDLMKAFSLK